MADEKVPTDWASDVKRYVPDADDTVIAAIVRHCGIALRTRDASMVSFSDATETDRVREKFCKKKLALTDSDAVIDDAIAKVGARMSDTNYRNRVTVYYLLAQHFGKLGLFAAKGAPSAAKTGAPAAAVPIVPLAAAGAAPAAATPAVPVAPPAKPDAVAPLAAAAIPTGTRGAYTLRPTAPAGGSGSADGFMGLAAIVFGGAAVVMIFAAIAGSYIAGRFDTEAPAPAAPAPAPAPVVEPAPAAIPEGAGVVSEVVEGRPKVSVYFAVGKNDIAPDFTAAVAPVKAWLDANPTDRARLSGFSDPTGNAAANAELAKNRAQAVAAALTAQGVAADRIDLVKPADTSDDTVDLAGARRVEITVTGG